MTRLVTRAVECHLCGHGSDQQILASTTASGYADLDFRPPPLERHTISNWLQLCGGCGYTAPDLSQPLPGAAEIVHTAGYTRYRQPPLENRFLSRALLLEALGQLARSGWRTLHAAWACDDAGNRVAAAHARGLAVERFRRAITAGQTFCAERRSENLLLIDALRRSAAWQDALTLCEAELDHDLAETLQTVLVFQRSLIRERDPRCYTFGDALDGTRSEGEDD